MKYQTLWNWIRQSQRSRLYQFKEILNTNLPQDDVRVGEWGWNAYIAYVWKWVIGWLVMNGLSEGEVYEGSEILTGDPTFLKKTELSWIYYQCIEPYELWPVVRTCIAKLSFYIFFSSEVDAENTFLPWIINNNKNWNVSFYLEIGKTRMKKFQI